MFVQERLSLIKKIVRKNRRMTFAELLQSVDVSPATLRRDLAELEFAKEVIRVHGGVLDPSHVLTEASFEDRMVLNSPAKKSIAHAAAQMVPPGATVLVDAGTTCLELGKALFGRKDVKLITHSIALIAAAFNAEATIICIGGQLRKVSGALVGSSPLNTLDLIHADIAFIGATGLDAREGCSTTELTEAEVKRSMISRATRKILLADNTKWNKPSTIHFAKWNTFSDWITDTAPGQQPANFSPGEGPTVHFA